MGDYSQNAELISKEIWSNLSAKINEITDGTKNDHSHYDDLCRLQKSSSISANLSNR
jgi:hypothetical protein